MFFPNILIALLLLTTGSVVAREDTDLGSAGNLSPQAVLEATKLIKTGKTYSLAIETGPDTPAYGHRRYQVLTGKIYVNGSPVVGKNKLVGIDDYTCFWMGVGTQIDGFAHISNDGRHFGGLPASDVVHALGAQRYGVEDIPPLVGRGVLLDMAAFFGTEMMTEGQVFNSKEIKQVARRQGVTLKRGDIVIFHTGWLNTAEQDAARFLGGEPGLGMVGAQYLADLGVAAVGADNWALEVIPAEDPQEFLPVHGLLLAKRGVHILENIKTQELIADQAYEFFFVLAAPRFVGAVQSPVHPVAIR